MQTISTFTFHLTKDQDLEIGSYPGRIIHGAFLQFLRNHDEELTHDLHSTNRRRPYTISTVNFNRRNSQLYSFGITTYDKRIVQSLIKLVIDDKPLEIFIVDRFLQVLKVEYTRHETPNPRHIKVGTTIQLRTRTPVIFSSTRRDAKTDPFPHLNVIWKQIIGPYSRIVEDVSSLDMDVLVHKLVEQLATPYFELKSTHISLGHKIRVTGFVGKILFKVEDSLGLELLPVFLQLAELWGIGSKTAMGFGRVKISIREPNRTKVKEDGSHTSRNQNKNENDPPNILSA